MKEKEPKSTLTAAQKKILREERSNAPAALQTAFEAAFEVWKESWFRGGLAISSDPRTRTVGREFDAFIALGPEILPLWLRSWPTRRISWPCNSTTRSNRTRN